MRVSIAPNGSQYPCILKEEKIDNEIKVTEGKSTEVQLPVIDRISVDAIRVQEANNAILRLANSVKMINQALDESNSPEPRSVAQTNVSDEISIPFQNVIQIANVVIGESPSPELTIDSEEIAITLVEHMNKTLMVLDEIRDADTPRGEGSLADKQGPEQLREIIVSAFKVTESIHELPTQTTLPGITFTHEGLLYVDRLSLKEAISANTVEVGRSIKTVTAALFETLPLCIDPNSGTLVYTGKGLEDGDYDKASKVSTVVNEELEKEKIELNNKLSMADLLISYSEKLIVELKPRSESTIDVVGDSHAG